MKTIGEVLKQATEFLSKKSILHPRRQAEELLALALNISRLEIYLHHDYPLVEGELARMREYLKRSAKGEPWQYISGKIDFLNCEIRVDQRVLIPRPETEILVDAILHKLPTKSLEIWDLCTGSGCIGIALKKHRPDCTVALSDISQEALEVAQENAHLNQVSVEFFQGDLLGPFQGRQADVIIVNPPYVSEKELAELDEGVKHWEPRLALLGGIEGWEFYQRLSLTLKSYLCESGEAFFEIGKDQGEVIRSLFPLNLWSHLNIMQDWSGYDRFVSLKRS